MPRHRARLPATALLSLALLAASLPAAPAFAPHPKPLDPFHIAIEALDSAGAGTHPLLQTQRANVDGARMLLDTLPNLQGDNLHRATAWAKLAQQLQYSALGIPLEHQPTPNHANPSQATYALLNHHNAIVSPATQQDLARLDRLPTPLRDALTATINAFLGFQDASTAAFAHADHAKHDTLQALAERIARGEPIPTEVLLNPPRLDQLGIRWGLLPPARDALLDAALQLHDALLATPPEELDAAAPLDVPGLLHIDLTTTDNAYTTDYAFLIDAGGNDVYLNNAGGGNGGIANCATGVPVHIAAALIDLGGEDAFGDGRDCGVNGGGAALAAGFLLHGSGNATYTGGRQAVNGGGYEGAGFLVDAGGDTFYHARGNAFFPRGGLGVNGGGEAGIGLLVDLSGDDTYKGSVAGVNGGGDLGAGILVDGAGNDNYIADTAGVNGGGHLGVGFLLDTGGDNQFLAGGAGANGGGDLLNGLLVSGTGNDTYVATGGGTNGGATYLGVGTLIDLGGNDAFTAGNIGTNGGNDRGLFGLLVDAGGEDSYVAGRIGNGEGSAGCLVPVFLVCVVFAGGIAGLVDLRGTDWYSDAHGSCHDCSIVPKGIVGAQVDTPG